MNVGATCRHTVFSYAISKIAEVMCTMCVCGVPLFVCTLMKSPMRLALSHELLLCEWDGIPLRYLCAFVMATCMKFLFQCFMVSVLLWCTMMLSSMVKLLMDVSTVAWMGGVYKCVSNLSMICVHVCVSN